MITQRWDTRHIVWCSYRRGLYRQGFIVDNVVHQLGVGEPLCLLTNPGPCDESDHFGASRYRNPPSLATNKKGQNLSCRRRQSVTVVIAGNERIVTTDNDLFLL